MGFGAVPINCSLLGKRIVELVRAKNLPGSGDHGKWTNAVYEVLGNIGREQGFEVIHEPRPGLSIEGTQASEFLLDLIWRSAGGIELGAEVEWGTTSDVLYDFQKLVNVKAPLKVLVYWASRTRDDGKGVRDGIESYMGTHKKHIHGEEYLLVEFGTKGVDRCYRCTVTEHNVTSALSLLGPSSTS